MPPAVALRPRSFSELFDAAFLLAREHFRPLATLAALLAIPAIAVNLVNVSLFGTVGVRGGPPALAVLHTLPLTAVVMCWYFVGVGALVHAVSNAYLGEPVETGTSVRRALRRAGALVGAHLLAYLAALAAAAVALLAVSLAVGVVAVALGAIGLRGTAANVVGGAIGVVGGLGVLAAGAAVLARYANMSTVVMLEGGGALAALRRSSALGAGQLARIVGVFAILIVVSLAFSLAALGLGALAGNLYVSSLVSTLLSIPLYPLAACVLTVLYYDLRIRKEGFDIAYAARALGDAPPQSVPAA